MDSRIKDFFAKMEQDLKDLWVNNKIFVILFGVIILIVKFRSLFASFLISDSKKTFENAVAKDSTLKTEENDANQQANALVEKAKTETLSTPPVDEDWNLKK